MKRSRKRSRRADGRFQRLVASRDPQDGLQLAVQRRALSRAGHNLREASPEDLQRAPPRRLRAVKDSQRLPRRGDALEKRRRGGGVFFVAREVRQARGRVAAAACSASIAARVRGDGKREPPGRVRDDGGDVRERERRRRHRRRREAPPERACFERRADGGAAQVTHDDDQGEERKVKSPRLVRHHLRDVLRGGLEVERAAQSPQEPREHQNRRGGGLVEPPLPGTGATRGQEAARQERVRGGADDAPPPERVPEAHQQQAPSERAHAVGGDEPGLRVRVGIFRELPRALLRERDVAGSDAVPGEEAPDGEEPEQVPLHRGRRERDRHADDATTRISRVSLRR